MNAPRITRRTALLGAAAGFVALAGRPRFSLAGDRDPRFVFLILRGGLDGLAVAAPTGDPDYERRRLAFGVLRDGPEPGLPLNDFFTLNANLAGIGELYRQQQATIFQAICSPYRDRSHFDGQDVLESGMPGVSNNMSGWLNRLAGVMPMAGGRRSPLALATDARVPLVLHGQAPVTTWIPPGFRDSPDTLRMRLASLYRHADTGMATAVEEAFALQSVTGGGSAFAESMATEPGGAKKPTGSSVAATALATGRLLASAGGPRIGVFEAGGWDTHTREAPVSGALANVLRRFDAALGQLKAGLGDAWRETVVLAATEFGRTVNINGSAGTDHGTASVAFLAGGAVRGGRVIADWPGLSDAALRDGRDLAATTDLRSVMKGVLADHFGVGRDALDTKIFPDSAKVAPMKDLLA